MSTNFRSLQERLRERLLAHINAGEFTGLQIARAAGFQQAHISNFLNRKRGLSLEAMDAVLRVTGIRLHELLPHPPKSKLGLKMSSGQCDEFLSIPIVSEANCTATQVPNKRSQDTIKIASAQVQRNRSQMRIPRPHWQRFIAIRVKPSYVSAMSPRLSHGSVAVIDRHTNAPARRVSSPDMFLLRTAEGFSIRHLEINNGALFARPLNPDLPVEVIESRDGGDPFSSIIGRLCLLQVQL